MRSAGNATWRLPLVPVADLFAEHGDFRHGRRKPAGRSAAVTVQSAEVYDAAGKVVGKLPRGVLLQVQRTEGLSLWIECALKGRVSDQFVVPLSEAESYFGDVVDRDPNDVVAWAARGRVRQNGGNVVGALSDYAAALVLSPTARPCIACAGGCF